MLGFSSQSNLEQTKTNLDCLELTSYWPHLAKLCRLRPVFATDGGLNWRLLIILFSYLVP